MAPSVEYAQPNGASRASAREVWSPWLRPCSLSTSDRHHYRHLSDMFDFLFLDDYGMAQLSWYFSVRSELRTITFRKAGLGLLGIRWDGKPGNSFHGAQ